jgi:hypothetical protein
MADPLEVVKFMCKEFWIAVFKKQVDNLRTNHRVSPTNQITNHRVKVESLDHMCVNNMGHWFPELHVTQLTSPHYILCNGTVCREHCGGCVCVDHHATTPG